MQIKENKEHKPQIWGGGKYEKHLSGKELVSRIYVKKEPLSYR